MWEWCGKGFILISVDLWRKLRRRRRRSNMFINAALKSFPCLFNNSVTFRTQTASNENLTFLLHMERFTWIALMHCC